MTRLFLVRRELLAERGPRAKPSAPKSGASDHGGGRRGITPHEAPKHPTPLTQQPRLFHKGGNLRPRTRIGHGASTALPFLSQRSQGACLPGRSSKGEGGTTRPPGGTRLCLPPRQRGGKSGPRRVIFKQTWTQNTEQGVPSCPATCRSQDEAAVGAETEASPPPGSVGRASPCTSGQAVRKPEPLCEVPGPREHGVVRGGCASGVPGRQPEPSGLGTVPKGEERLPARSRGTL